MIMKFFQYEKDFSQFGAVDEGYPFGWLTKIYIGIRFFHEIFEL